MPVQSTLRALALASAASLSLATGYRWMCKDRKWKPIAANQNDVTKILEQWPKVTGSTKLCPCYDGKVLQHYPSKLLPSSENILIRKSYLTSVSFRNKIPNWVAEKLTADGLDGDQDRATFVADVDVPAKWRSDNADFWDSGFSRGHLAAAGNHKESKLSMMQTFLLSGNVLPQDVSNNMCDWYRLENLCKRFGKSCENVFVISGPLWLPSDTTQDELKTFVGETVPRKERKFQKRSTTYHTIGDGLSVPTHLFKVVVAANPKLLYVRTELEKNKQADKPEIYPRFINPSELATMGNIGLAAFIMPNAPEVRHKTLNEFKVPLEAVEVLAGLDLEGLVDFCRAAARKEHKFRLRGIKACGTGQSADEVLQRGAIERRKFLASVDLCGADGSRCEDEYVKADKRIQSARFLGRVTSSKTLDGLEHLWKEINDGGFQKDFFLKKQYDARYAALETAKAVTAAKAVAVAKGGKGGGSRKGETNSTSTVLDQKAPNLKKGIPEIATKGKPEIATKGKPEIATKGIPEIATKGKPEIATKGKPEIAKSTEAAKGEGAVAKEKNSPPPPGSPKSTPIAKEAAAGAASCGLPGLATKVSVGQMKTANLPVAATSNAPK